MTSALGCQLPNTSFVQKEMDFEVAAEERRRKSRRGGRALPSWIDASSSSSSSKSGSCSGSDRSASPRKASGDESTAKRKGKSRKSRVRAAFRRAKLAALNVRGLDYERRQVGADSSGLRVVVVRKKEVRHKWFTLDELANYVAATSSQGQGTSFLSEHETLAWGGADRERGDGSGDNDVEERGVARGGEAKKRCRRR